MSLSAFDEDIADKQEAHSMLPPAEEDELEGDEPGRAGPPGVWKTTPDDIFLAGRTAMSTLNITILTETSTLTLRERKSVNFATNQSRPGRDCVTHLRPDFTTVSTERPE